jgi:hypothetical protein
MNARAVQPQTPSFRSSGSALAWSLLLSRTRGYRLEHRLVSGLLIRVAPAMRAEADR